MDEPLGVCRIERRPDLPDDVRRTRRRQRTLREQVGERLPSYQPHVDVEMAVDLAPVVDRDHMRFLQDRGGSRLALKPCPEALVAGVLVGQDLQRDGASLVGVVGLVHLTHPAPADQARDGVLAERRADARFHPGSISRQASSGASSLRGTEISRGPVLSAGISWPSPKKNMTASSVSAKFRQSEAAVRAWERCSSPAPAASARRARLRPKGTPCRT